ncbi:uncharacterized protein LOC116843313 [Odontomachus brunneus]|uniref:uncharacterized protein LOC116843313 n=1 Tax=Odontomachus brunneus TaxID=486640 RepID=UPI0013F2AAA1|nr:uncharacterized protein LOC116843313 [Odontomachus brunneus]XP_032669547.1 uncharacterized protein LOC116843313 [Odontomachus brunneus]
MNMIPSNCHTTLNIRDDIQRRNTHKTFNLYIILIYMLIYIFTITSIHTNGKKFQLQIKFFDRELSNLSEIYTNDDDSSMMSLIKFGYNSSTFDFNKTQYFLRNLSALQTSEIQNFSMIKDERTDIFTSQKRIKSLRIKKSQRNIRKSKKEQQNKRRFNRIRRQSEFHNRSNSQNYPLLATFIGLLPEQFTDDTFIIGPWKVKNRRSNPFEFTKFRLVDDDMSIQIITSGLYMISVQIFYYGESMRYSYQVILHSKDNSERILVRCATAACDVTGKMTCHTSVIVYLERDDVLSVYQNEMDRFVNLREGYSHIHLVMLATNE